MSTPAPARTTFSADELSELLALIKKSDSVELKVTVPESDQRSTVAALGIDPLDSQIRQVLFFETPELGLDKQGVVVRARRIQGKGDDSVVKLRPVVPETLSDDLRRSAGFRVEVDALPGGFVCSGTMKGTLGADDVKRFVAGERPLRKLFSKEQRAYYAAHVDGVALDDLITLGPITILKVPFTPKKFPHKLVAELWFYPDGSRILELSTRTTTAEAFQTAAELRSYLADRGVDVSGEQETKTRKALDYFAKSLKKAS